MWASDRQERSFPLESHGNPCSQLHLKGRQMNNAECNYPVHKQEMLAITRALKKWRVDLLGSHIQIRTDHKTLQNLDFQCDLSQWQARWMEYLSQYEYTITYINGDKNTIADALSRLPDSVDREPTVVVASAVFSIQSNLKLITWIKNGYHTDPWCLGILEDLKWGMLDAKLNIALKHGLLFIRSRLVILKYKNLRKQLFQLVHDNLGHFGMEKSYSNLWNDFYWPNMRRDLVHGYVPGCTDCQRNKSSTSKPAGPLHPLPIPDRWFESVAIDFIGPLPVDNGFNAIVTMMDQLGTDIQITACKTDMTAEDFAFLFFNRWYCENSCP